MLINFLLSNLSIKNTLELRTMYITQFWNHLFLRYIKTFYNHLDFLSLRVFVALLIFFLVHRISAYFIILSSLLINMLSTNSNFYLCCNFWILISTLDLENLKLINSFVFFPANTGSFYFVVLIPILPRYFICRFRPMLL